MTVEGNLMGGLTVGFESMISTVLPGSPVEENANTSVRSSRVSSPGNLRLSALKWLDMVAPSVVIRTGDAIKGGSPRLPVAPGKVPGEDPPGCRSRGSRVHGAEGCQRGAPFLGSVGGNVG